LFILHDRRLLRHFDCLLLVHSQLVLDRLCHADGFGYLFAEPHNLDVAFLPACKSLLGVFLDFLVFDDQVVLRLELFPGFSLNAGQLGELSLFWF